MTQPLPVVMIGAGNVNFGGGEGPWDHASRLEAIDGVAVVAVVDPDRDRAAEALRERTHPNFARARPFAELDSALAETRPVAAWIGVPPDAHGTVIPGADVEMACLRRGIHCFVEKPLAALPPDAVAPVGEALARSGILASVGYMFRYSRAAERIREILAAHGPARAFLGRYNCAYTEIRKREWWDRRRTGGVLVEQATHFVDLARHLVGEVDTATVRAQRIEGEDRLAELAAVPVDDAGREYQQGVPPAERPPRATSLQWRFREGALGTLLHGTLLHGRRYESDLEIWGDGLRIRWEDPYGANRLRIRLPGHDDETVEDHAGEDPYLEEDRAFVEAIRRNDPAPIRCTYADALETHRLAWAMTVAGS